MCIRDRFKKLSHKIASQLAKWSFKLNKAEYKQKHFKHQIELIPLITKVMWKRKSFDTEVVYL